MFMRGLAPLLLAPLVGCSKPATGHDTASTVAPPSATIGATAPAAPSWSSSLSASAPTTTTAAPAIFPSAGTKVTFRGAARDGKPDTWTATITAIDGGLFQYQPHHDTANFFTKAGFRADGSGIYVAGESLEGRGPVTRVVALPFVAKASAELPSGMFSATYTVTARESVTVPAGKFEAWRVAVKDKLNPEGAAWIASGTGIVKIRLPTGRVDELVAIELPK